MPKKFVGENSKATAARERKEAVKNDKREKEERAKEDARWEDDDKNAQKKQQRKAEQEQKRQQALEKKQELKKLHDEEINTIANSAPKPKSAVPSTTTKVTLHAIEMRKQAEQQRLQREREAAEKKQEVVAATEEIEENINRLDMDADVASNVDEAIQVLASSTTPTVDRHPEKRVKAAYTAFEERRLPELKQQHPTFRLSQLKQLLKKEWQKSAENPLNQKILNIIQQ